MRCILSNRQHGKQSQGPIFSATEQYQRILIMQFSCRKPLLQISQRKRPTNLNKTDNLRLNRSNDICNSFSLSYRFGFSDITGPLRFPGNKIIFCI